MTSIEKRAMLVLWASASIFLISCDGVRIQPPGQNPGGNGQAPGQPNIPHPLSLPLDLSVLQNLQEAATSIEGYGQYAKGNFTRNQHAQAQQLYISAIAKHNGCIRLLSGGLGTQQDQNRLRNELTAADQMRTQFINYCKQQHIRQPRKPFWRRNVAEVQAGAGSPIAEIAEGLLGSLFGSLVDLYIQQQRLNAEIRGAEIARLQAELDKCECRHWGEL